MLSLSSFPFAKQTRILVTHGIHWLPMVDKIVVLSDGNIAEYGTYEELISRGGVFAQFLKSYLDQDAESEQEEDAEGIKLISFKSIEHINEKGHHCNIQRNVF